jgi:hypothetical protein
LHVFWVSDALALVGKDCFVHFDYFLDDFDSGVLLGDFIVACKRCSKLDKLPRQSIHTEMDINHLKKGLVD